MPTTNPRVNVVLEEPVYEGLRRWAKRDGVSLSLKVRDLSQRCVGGRRGPSACRLGERSRADARPEQGQDAFANLGTSQAIETLTPIHDGSSRNG